MAEIGRWNGYKFQITSNVIRGFTGLTVKGACETEDKKKKKSLGYVKRKQGKPSEVSLTVVLSAAIGCDVRNEAMNLVNSATAGAKDYFYIGSHKLLACKLMLVEASLKEVSVGMGDTWIAAQVQLTMKQCDKGGSSSSGSGKKKKSKKKSVKKKSTKKAKSSGGSGKAKSSGGSGKKSEVDAVTGAAPSVTKMQVKVAQTAKKAVTSATATIKKITTAAKKLTASKKSTTKATNPSSSSRGITGAKR